MTHYSPVRGRGSRWYRDVDGYLTDTKREDEVLDIKWDITDALDTGETIASVAYDESGLTVNSSGSSGNIITLNVTETGSVEITATLSSGRKLQEAFRFRGEDAEATDYAD
jgi:hypothetical protein